MRHTRLSLPMWSSGSTLNMAGCHLQRSVVSCTSKVAVSNQPYPVRTLCAGGKQSRKVAVITGALAFESSLKLKTLSWHRSGGKVRTPCPARTRRGRRDLAKKTWGMVPILPAFNIGDQLQVCHTPHCKIVIWGQLALRSPPVPQLPVLEIRSQFSSGGSPHCPP